MKRLADTSNEKLLRVHDLKTFFFTTYGIVKAVDGIDLKIDKGEAIGLVGESGCGKTVTALSIMRLVPDPPGRIIAGEISWKGQDLLVLGAKEVRRVRGKEISMVFQDPMTFLNPVIKVGDQISETILLHQSVTKKEANRKAIELLEKVRIPSATEVVEHYPHQLSGGMRQRVLIAIAISCNPALLIADEPTTALDVTVQSQVLNLIEQLRKELNTSLLLITHDLGIVAKICDRVYVMYAGKIVEQADVFSLYENPKHPYTIGLLKSTLSINEYKKTLKAIEGTVPNLINPPSGCRFHPRCHHAKSICRVRQPAPVEVEPGNIVYCWLFRREV